MKRTARRASVRDSLLVVAAAIPTVELLLHNPRNGYGLALILAGTVAALALGLRRRLAAPTGVVWSVTVSLAAIAVARPPLGSRDIWSYAMYGRILEHYGRNPWVAVPAQFPGDRILSHTGWQHTPSAYGPLFVFVAAVVSRVAGTNLFALRLGFQGLAACAAVLTIWIAAHLRRDVRVVALLGLQPFVWCSVVNGGHNDVYLGVALVAALALLARGRSTTAALVISLSSLVKPTALLALPLVVVAAGLRDGRRAAIRAALTGGAVYLIGAALAPASVFSASHATAGLISRASPWRFITEQGVTVNATAISVAVSVAIAVFVGWRCRTSLDFATAAALALGSYAIVGSYMLAWYCAWSLGAAAIARRRIVTALLTAHAGLLFAAYQLGRTGVVNHDAHMLLTEAVPVLTVVSYAAVVAWASAGPFAASRPMTLRPSRGRRVAHASNWESSRSASPSTSATVTVSAE